MESSAIGWKMIKNTVTNRMLDSSFVHKLIPSSRLRRKCKAMNMALKQQYNLRTYRQYVKMKTDILRNISDDEETDVSDNFSEDDYDILYKNNLYLTDHETLTPNKNVDVQKTELAVDKNDIVPHRKNKNAVRQKVKKRVKVANLAWQEVKRKTKKIVNDSNNDILHESPIIIQRITNHESDINSDLQVSSTNENSLSCSKESSLVHDNETLEHNEICTIENGAQLNGKVTNSNEIMPDVTKIPQSTDNSNEPMEQINSTVNKVNERHRSNEDHYCRVFNSPEKRAVEEIKKNLISLLDDVNDTKNEIDNSFAYTKVCLNKSHFNTLESNTNDQGTSLGEGKSHESLNIQPLLPNSRNQPKDSGIEEDTEEEVLENKSKNHNKSKNESPENMKMVLDDVHNSTDHQEIVEKYKPQPRVSCTEIVSKKYKIISRDTSFASNCTNSELSLDDFDNEEACETQKTVESIEDNISFTTEKRLQQLRRLNLSIESESSLSEDDNLACSIEIMKNNLFRRSRESSDISEAEDKNLQSKLAMLIQSGKKLQKNKSSRIKDYQKENTMQLGTNNKESKKHKKRKKYKDEESVQSSGSIPKCSVKEDLAPTGSSSNCTEETTTRSNRKRYRKAEKCNSENEPIESVVLNEKKKAIRGRPNNLEQLMNTDGLISQTMKPSFTFEDICEDDIFVLDIPSMAFEKSLLGKKMILTEKKLKLGKRKYKIEYKDIGNISCIFGRDKSRKPYKTVNIKPAAKIIAREKIIKTSLLKPVNQYMNDESNYEADDNYIEDKVTSTKKHVEMEHKVPFKRKRYNNIIG